MAVTDTTRRMEDASPRAATLESDASINAEVTFDGVALRESIKTQAQELGFLACGIAGVGSSHTADKLQAWLGAGYNASMAWMARPERTEKCGNPRLVLPNCQSMICVAMSYRTQAEWDAEACGKVARYARGGDYHDVMPQRLRALLSWIQEHVPCEGRVYADTGPILEREWAQRAGLGWIGKNTLLMSRQFGSYVLLGEILLNIPLPPDAPHVAEYCGTCTRCLDACPTQAFVAPRVLDANKCISFHTIENRERAPQELRAKFNDWVFGCDICQEVCPWNHKGAENPAAFSSEPQLWTREAFPTLRDAMTMPQEEFSRRLKGSPLKRTKRRGFKRNALTVLKNRRNQQALNAPPKEVNTEDQGGRSERNVVK